MKKIAIYVLSVLAVLSVACEKPGETDKTDTSKSETVEGLHVPDVSGDYYDWRATGKPERPYMIPYHKSMLMKIYLADPKLGVDANGNTCTVNTVARMTYTDIIRNIAKLDALSRGMHKVIYLVGWQYNGHDDGYPAFYVFNSAIAGSEGNSAKESFLNVQKKAMEEYNTSLSVHINLNNARSDSREWGLYLRNDLLCKKADGSLYKWGDILGLPNNQVNFVNEWEKGYTARRIDKVTELCNLTYVKTVHIDAFQPHASEYHGQSRSDMEKVMRKIIRYWRDKGVDVTTEFFKGHTREDMFIGLSPASWWNELNPSERLQIGPELACSGEAGTCEGANDYNEWGFLFGETPHGETYLTREPDYAKFKHEFCTMAVPFVYLNTHKALEHSSGKVQYSDGLVADWLTRTLTKNGNLVRKNNDIFIPALWIEDHREIIAYSELGYTSYTWKMPAGWEDVSTVQLWDVTTDGLKNSRTANIRNGELTLTLSKGQMLSIQPYNN